MDSATHDVQAGREETRAALTEKIAMLEQRVRDSVEEATATVKRTVDIDYQIDHHPWRTMGLSLLFGYLAGSMIPMRAKTKSPPADTVQGRQSEHAENSDISVIKAAMVGAMTGLIRDVVRDGMPVLASYVNEKAKSTNLSRSPRFSGDAGANATPMNGQPATTT